MMVSAGCFADTSTRSHSGDSNMLLRILCLLLGVGFLHAPLSSAADRPNIILLMGDDHGWDETGYNGHPHLQTPVLDEMSKTGLRLDRFYSAHPSCSPTRGSVMTGRHPNRYGTFAPGFSLRPAEITIAKLLASGGYQCGHFGKWHLGPVKADSPTNPHAMGFHHYVSHDNFFELDPWLSRDGAAPQQFKGESSQIVIDEAIEFLKSAKQANQPSFTVVWFGSPHEPYSGLPEDLALYDNLPAKYASQQTTLTSNETGKPTTRQLDQVLRERFAEITAMDRSIGVLRDWLADNELKDNTIVWYCGDNGTSADGIVTSPLRGQKGNHYEGGVRVPGLIEWPNKIPKPRVSDVNSVTSDILPTLCDIAGVDLPSRPLDGISLLPLVDGKMKSRDKPICFWTFDMKSDTQREPYLGAQQQTGTTPLVKKQGTKNTRDFDNYRHPEIRDSDFGGTRVILGNRYKLIVSGSGKKEKRELFDVRRDAAEKDDVANTEPQVAKTLQKQLRKWQSSVLESLTDADYEAANMPSRVAPAQAAWYEKYKDQENIPKPDAMLLNTDAEPELTAGFVPMFNGTDLSGWSPKGGTCHFEWKNDMLVGTNVKGSESTYLSTHKSDYADFVFTCDVKWEVDGNTGVMFRAQSKPGKNATETVFGPQAEMEGITGDRYWNGGIYGQSCGGYFYPLWLKEHAAAREALKRTDWNRLTVKAQGDVVKTWINGVPAAHWIDNGTYPKGFFGIQVHKGDKGTVMYRNVRVKEL